MNPKDYILQSGTLVGLNPVAITLEELYDIRGCSPVNSDAMSLALQHKSPIGLDEDAKVDYLITLITQYQEDLKTFLQEDEGKSILGRWLRKGLFTAARYMAKGLRGAIMGMARGLVFLLRGLLLRPAVFIVRTIATALGRIVVSALTTTPMGLAALATVGGAYLAYRTFSNRDLDTDSTLLEDLGLTRNRLSDKELSESLVDPQREPKAGAFSEEHLVKAMDKAGITDPLERAHFLGQTMHESGGGRYPEEIWANTPAQQGYEGRKDLGNTEPGDGYRYRGSGYIHLTGRANFRAAGEYLGIDLENNPDWVRTDPDIAAATSIWYWKVARPKLGYYARNDDLLMVSTLINGRNPNGLEDRRRRTEHYKKLTGYGQKYGYKEGSSVPVETAKEDGIITSDKKPESTSVKSSDTKEADLTNSSPPLTPVKVGSLILQADI